MWWRSLPVSFDGSGPSDPNVVNTEEERAMVRSHSRSRRPLGSVALGMSAVLAWYGCGGEPRDVTAPESQSSSVALQPLEQGFERARAAQERHTRRLLAIEGVTGTAVGFANDGRAVVTIFTKVGGIHGLPASLDDVPVVVAVTGELFALGNFRRGGVARRDLAPSVPCTLPPAVTPAGEFCPPVPIGVSTGNVTAADCATGTIGARVIDGSGKVYALSNNHVYALTNRAPLGSLVAQPGLVDDGCVTPEIDDDATLSDVIGPLAAFQTIAFCHGHKCPANTIDAAIASSTTDELGDGTPADGYGPPASGSGVSASVGQSVEKYGRTTAQTTGTVTGINASVLVNYGSGKTALFVHQIVFEKSGLPVIGAGDSGSLLVTTASHSGVGLLFAGNASGSMAIGNPIGAVLTRFRVTID